MDHSQDYINETRKPLGHVNDQLVEASHAYVNKRLVNSNYNVKDVTSDIHAEKLRMCILHINSFNL